MKVRRKRVLVEWVDAAGSATWRDLAEGKRYKVAHCVSLGWVLRETKRKIVIAASLNVKDQSVADVTAIPKGWITKVRSI